MELPITLHVFGHFCSICGSVGTGLVLDNKVKMVHQDRGRRVLCNVMNETIQELQCDSNGVCPLLVISEISDI